MKNNNKIIGRDHELKQLNNALSSPKAEFIAVYGRRRVGKTYLIREFFSVQACHFFQLTGIKQGTNRLKLQLTELSKELEKTFYQDFKSTRIETPKNWHSALAALNDAIELTAKLSHNGKKTVLFFDELPWMATPKSGLLEAIDYFWNRYWTSNPNVILIICGSSSSWIIEKVLNNKGGLHNRVTLRLPLHVFNLHDTQAFLHNKDILLNQTQVTQLYMAVGGVPFYLDKVEKGLSATQLIDTLCFSENNALSNEFNNLYESLFSQAEAYIELIRLIAQKPYGITRGELSKKAKLSQKGGTLSKRLTELTQSGFINETQPPHKQRQRTYQCIDEYTLFYLRWIEPVQPSYVGNDYWQSLFHTPDYYAWAGIAFEVLCYKHIEQIKKALRIPNGSIAYTWRSTSNNHQAQVDLVFERKDGVINLCEIKYTKEPFSIDKNYYQTLLNKMRRYQQDTGTSKQIFMSLISANGLKQNEYSGIITETATLEDLFE